MSLSFTAVLAEGEKSLLSHEVKLAGDFGVSAIITEDDKGIVEAIRKSGKTDFKEGFYAAHFPDRFVMKVSDLFFKMYDVKGYDKLVFDVRVLTPEDADLDALMAKKAFQENWKDHYGEYDSFKEEFEPSKGVDNGLNIHEIEEHGYIVPTAQAQVNIFDGDWEVKYIINPTNEWQTIEVDISRMDGLLISCTMQGRLSTLIANPKLVKEPPAKAVPTSSTVYVNGQAIEFDAYNINGNNYFKLRDLAYALSGTEKQFEVMWNEQAKAIELISDMPYTPVGGELSKGDGQVKIANKSNAYIYLNWYRVYPKAYNINNNNYFKLRDIGELFNFGVDWDANTNSIIIDTSIDYIPE